jgi:hypothetical protein
MIRWRSVVMVKTPIRLRGGSTHKTLQAYMDGLDFVKLQAAK